VKYNLKKKPCIDWIKLYLSFISESFVFEKAPRHLVNLMSYRQLKKKTFLLMRICHPKNSLVVSRNLWLILLSKIWLILNLVKKIHQKFLKFQGSQICAYFFSSYRDCWVFNHFVREFSLNKSCKTYLDPMLPPGARNWQPISPHLPEPS